MGATTQRAWRSAVTRSCIDANKLMKRNKYIIGMREERSYCQLSCSLIPLFWLLLIFLFPNRGLSNRKEDSMQLLRYDGQYVEVVNTRNDENHTPILENDLSSTNHNSSNSKDEDTSSSCLMSRLPEVILNMLYSCPLCCATENYDEMSTGAVRKTQNGSTQHSSYLNFEEFRNLTRVEKDESLPSEFLNITHRLEPDGKEYNYASSLKGAKVVAHSKETKGADNILGQDHDKYLRNPCSSRGKFVVIELSEETLVDVVKIANYEHYSSNLREFELFGSLKFPSESWTPLGNFSGANVKQLQSFKLQKPKWVRYLNLSLISHHGAEFYCTLSAVEVYGMDAIERMLEVLLVTVEEPPSKPLVERNITKSADVEISMVKVKGEKSEEIVESGTLKESRVFAKKELMEARVPDAVAEVRQKPLNRVPGDTVMKILMQKVKSLEFNLAVLEQYIKELNKRQGDTFPELDKLLANMSAHLTKTLNEASNLLHWKALVDKNLKTLDSVKETVSSRLDDLAVESINLRLDIDRVKEDQTNLESKELSVLAASFAFFMVSMLKLVFSCGQQMCSDSNRGWVLVLCFSSLTMLISLV